jgi:hypothetical protein
VLRAFSTLEGIGKTLVPTYRFSDVAQPYATVGGGAGGMGAGTGVGRIDHISTCIATTTPPKPPQP